MVWALILKHSTLLCTIECSPPYPLCTPYNYFLQQTVSTMEWALLLMHSILLCTIEGTPPYTPCFTPYNYSLRDLILNGLHPTLYDRVDSTLLLCYAQRTVSTMEWALLLKHSTLLCTIEWSPPYPLCTPYNYFLQQTVSTMEWALLLMHSTLLCTIGLHPTLCATPYNYFLKRSPFEWTPPYPVLFSGLRPNSLYCTLPPPPPPLYCL